MVVFLTQQTNEKQNSQVAKILNACITLAIALGRTSSSRMMKHFHILMVTLLALTGMAACDGGDDPVTSGLGGVTA
jgi:hypothetical protein